MLLIWKDTLNRKIQTTVWVSTVHRDQDQTEAKTRGGHTEPPPTSCFILTRTKTHQWPGHNHLEHIKHRPCRDRRIMLNHPGKINITAPIKSNADLRLALSISIDPADIHNVKHAQYSSTRHCCSCNRKQLLSAPIRQNYHSSKWAQPMKCTCKRW